ncbi:hypothetical protein CEXT_244451 [Caerostris extrusa]|uniref:Uncharacterized protein n=1 Tax=Caerostris extrusa TaxID=172846 RepID=A0AAV4VJT0_CAEEX|nr:hypothetical protein CEXT_244451 [Caerostris extrusa]
MILSKDGQHCLKVLNPVLCFLSIGHGCGFQLHWEGGSLAFRLREQETPVDKGTVTRCVLPTASGNRGSLETGVCAVEQPLFAFCAKHTIVCLDKRSRQRATAAMRFL